MEYSARYVHKISPSEKDVKGPFAISSLALNDRTNLGAQLRKVRVLGKGERIASFRVEPGFRIVAFPQASIWHSIILELTPIGVHHLAREAYLSTRKLAEKPDAFTHKGMAARVAILKQGHDYLAKLSKAKHATDSSGWNQSKAWADDLGRELSKDEARRDYFEKHERGENPHTSRQPGRSQEEHFSHAHAKSAGADETMLNLLYGPNAISDDELRKLIAKRPHVYGKYAAYLGKRGSGAKQKHERGENPEVTGFANRAEASTWASKRLPKGLKHKIEEVPNPGHRARKFAVRWRGKAGESARLGEHLKDRMNALVGKKR